MALRVSRDADQIANEVVKHLVALVDAGVEIKLEISAVVPTGVPDEGVGVPTAEGMAVAERTATAETALPASFSLVRAAGLLARTSLAQDYAGAPSSRRQEYHEELERLAEAEREELSSSAELSL